MRVNLFPIRQSGVNIRFASATIYHDTYFLFYAIRIPLIAALLKNNEGDVLRRIILLDYVADFLAHGEAPAPTGADTTPAAGGTLFAGASLDFDFL